MACNVHACPCAPDDGLLIHHCDILGHGWKLLATVSGVLLPLLHDFLHGRLPQVGSAPCGGGVGGVMRKLHKGQRIPIVMLRDRIKQLPEHLVEFTVDTFNLSILFRMVRRADTMIGADQLQ